MLSAKPLRMRQGNVCNEGNASGGVLCGAGAFAAVKSRSGRSVSASVMGADSFVCGGGRICSFKSRFCAPLGAFSSFNAGHNICSVVFACYAGLLCRCRIRLSVKRVHRLSRAPLVKPFGKASDCFAKNPPSKCVRRGMIYRKSGFTRRFPRRFFWRKRSRFYRFPKRAILP